MLTSHPQSAAEDGRCQGGTGQGRKSCLRSENVTKLQIVEAGTGIKCCWGDWNLLCCNSESTPGFWKCATEVQSCWYSHMRLYDLRSIWILKAEYYSIGLIWSSSLCSGFSLFPWAPASLPGSSGVQITVLLSAPFPYLKQNKMRFGAVSGRWSVENTKIYT